MQHLVPVLALMAFFVSAGSSAAEETPVLLHPSGVPQVLLPGIVEDGRIVVGGPQVAPAPGVSGGVRPATDLIMGPALNQRPSPMQPAYPRPVGELVNRPPDLNRLNAFFSSASGGFGFRMAFDRRISPTLRFTSGPEFLTYGLQQSLARLGSAMPEGVTRITLMSIPVGFQRQFAAQDRVIPHIGFGVGPIVRFDHRAGAPGFYPGYSGYGYGPGGVSVNTGFGSGAGGGSVGIGLPLEDFPQLSLTMGGFVGTGMNIRLGKKKDLALSVEGRYTLARFTESLGSPGDFSGLSVAIGFGKYF